MDVEKTIEFLLEHQARFEVRMAKLTDKMDAMLDHQIGMEERHDREMADIRAVSAESRAELRRGIRSSIEEQRRERVRRNTLDLKLDKLATSLQALVDAMKQERNGGNGKS
jgi:hypothetical protein